MQHKLKEQEVIYENKIKHIRCKKRSVAFRLRYDRIALVLVAFTLVIVAISLLVGAIKGAKVGDGEEANDTNEPKTHAINLAPRADNSKAVYLSPSNQWDNEYTGVDTTEAEQMRCVAEKVRAYLIDKGLKVYMAGEDLSLVEKVDLANDLGVGIYVSIHSNAGDGLGEGTECFYNSRIAGSKQLASFVYNRVAAATPTDDRGIINVHDTELYEIQNTEMASCLVEVEFHDIKEHAQWIVDNTDALAEAIGDGIMEYYYNVYIKNK